MLRLPCAPFWARELARVAPARIPEVILMKIDMCSDLAFLRGRSWDRTSDPSLVRSVTTTPPPALTLVSAGQREQGRAQPSSRKPPRAERAPIRAPTRGPAAAAVTPCPPY